MAAKSKVILIKVIFFVFSCISIASSVCLIVFGVVGKERNYTMDRECDLYNNLVLACGICDLIVLILDCIVAIDIVKRCKPDFKYIDVSIIIYLAISCFFFYFLLRFFYNDKQTQ